MRNTLNRILDIKSESVSIRFLQKVHEILSSWCKGIVQVATGILCIEILALMNIYQIIRMSTNVLLVRVSNDTCCYLADATLWRESVLLYSPWLSVNITCWPLSVPQFNCRNRDDNFYIYRNTAGQHDWLVVHFVQRKNNTLCLFFWFIERLFLGSLSGTARHTMAAA
jgi:hypothetical protein